MKYVVTIEHSPSSSDQAVLGDNIWTAEGDKLRDAVVEILNRNPPLPLIGITILLPVKNLSYVEIDKGDMLTSPTVEGILDAVRKALEELMAHAQQEGWSE